MATPKGSPIASPGFENLYPKIWQSYQKEYGKIAIPPDVWSFFHELHLLQSARTDSEVNDIVWAFGVYATAAQKVETRRSMTIAMMLITGLPSKEHEAWFELAECDGHVEFIVASHPDKQSMWRDRSRFLKTAAVVAIILSDFQIRWDKLEPWQRAFMASDVGIEFSTMFKEAIEIVQVMNQDAFGFLCARHLIRAGSDSLALRLLQQMPPNRLSDIVQYSQPGLLPIERHTYYELHSRFLVNSGFETAAAFLTYLVKMEAYSDDMLAVYLHNESLSDVTSFVIDLVSRVRSLSSGMPLAGLSHAGDSSPANQGRCFPCLFGKKAAKQTPVVSSTMLLLISNIPHILLWELLQRYEALDSSGREILLHDREFQQGLEVVFLLYDSDMVVRGVERMSETHQEMLWTVLQDWSRLHLLRLLDQNRPPSYAADAVAVNDIVSGQAYWIWAPSERRSRFFKSDVRNSEELALILWIFFEVSMFLDPLIIRRFLSQAHSRTPPIDVLDMFFPFGSDLYDAVATGVSKRSPNLACSEIRLLMQYTGFYEEGMQDYLRNAALERPRSVFSETLAFARLIQVVARLFSFRDGPMDRQALESGIDQICSACHGDSTCLRLMGSVMQAALQKDDMDFLPDGAEDVHSSASAFSVAGLASCARRLRVACDTIRIQTVKVTFNSVVWAFLETPPKGWVPLFNSLETVLFFLRFVAREDLKLAYHQFDKENREGFATDNSMQKFLKGVRQYYKAPFIDFKEDATDLCNLDVRAKLNSKKLSRKSRTSTSRNSTNGLAGPGVFSNDDWNIVVDIAGCAAESMKEKYNVPMLPHHTQMITLIMLASQICEGPQADSATRTILGKVGTGEGKSWIIAMLAAYVARKGMRAHVVIDNETLLARDYATMSAIFQKMGINCGKGDLDKGHQVVYCSSIDIEMYFMEKMKLGAAINFKGVMIVDEVDSLMMDENSYQSYVDDFQEGSHICDWCCGEGQGANVDDFEPWKQKVIRQMEAAQYEAQNKRQDQHYMVDDHTGMIWAVDERTGAPKRSAWFLWLEVLRKQRIADYRIRYMTRQNVICTKSCFSSYSFIFGLTGSLGTKAEQEYTKKHFNASCFLVPPFLDTCKGTSRPRAMCLQTRIAHGAQDQLRATVNMVQKHCAHVPILVVVRDAERTRRVADTLKQAIPSHALGDKLGPGIIELVDRPGKEAEFQQMVEVATQPLEGASGSGAPTRFWRVTVTTAVGARGQDYHISDELVDEKGGFLLVLEYVPDSEREWIQFLGRTARHDHPGQYAVILNAEEYRDVQFGQRGPSPDTVVKEILEHMNKVNELKLAGTEDQLRKGVLMHEFTTRFWAWMKVNEADRHATQERMGQWVDLCETFESKLPEQIKADFEEMKIPEKNSPSKGNDGDIDHTMVGDIEAFEFPEAFAEPEGIYTGSYYQGLREGEGRCTFDDGRVFTGQWAKGKISGTGKMTWPNGQVYEGQYLDDKRSGAGYIRWSDGRSYQGQWVKGTQHGAGVYTNQNGMAWAGEWAEGRKVDKSSTISTSGSSDRSREKKRHEDDKGKRSPDDKGKRSSDDKSKRSPSQEKSCNPLINALKEQADIRAQDTIDVGVEDTIAGI